jgi:endonuclease/exonuclease/phosphatase family metal-dependent hydrolase
MKLKVISFNIRCCDDKGGNSVAERAPRLASVTEPYGADVIGVQEYTPLWEKPLEEYFGDKYEIFNKYRCTEGHIESAPLLWLRDKFECIKKGYFWLSDTPEIESRGWDTLPHNRICLYAVLRDNESKKSFVFMNTHFGFGDECQTKSAALISEYADKISDLPTFTTGDFNMTPKSAGYAEMIKTWRDVNSLTVSDMRSTFHGYDLSIKRDEHIDYCFINDKIKPISLKLIDETVQGKYPSDHYGLLVSLEI